MSNKSSNSQLSLFTQSIAPLDASNYQTVAKLYEAKVASLRSVITRLREEDLKKGYAFLIFDDTLPEDQAYYEYPDGRICIEQLDKRNIEIPRVLVKALNRKESDAVRKKYALAG